MTNDTQAIDLLKALNLEVSELRGELGEQGKEITAVKTGQQAMKDQLDLVNRHLQGNGQPGVLKRVAQLEARSMVGPLGVPYTWWLIGFLVALLSVLLVAALGQSEPVRALLEALIRAWRGNP